MAKKVISIFLSMLMLLTLFSSSAVFAAVPSTPFTSEGGLVAVGSTGFAADNLDQHVSPTSVKDYGNATNPSAALYYQPSAQNAPMKIKSAGDENATNNVLEVSNYAYGFSYLTSYKFTVQPNYISAFSYDVCFTALPETALKDGPVRFGYSGSGGIYLEWDTSINGYKLHSPHNGKGVGVINNVPTNKWYTVSSFMDGSGNLKVYLLDRDTQEILIRASCQGKTAVGNSYNFHALYLPVKRAADGDFTAQFDNFKTGIYDVTASTPAIASSSLENDAEDVSVLTKSVTVVFDQEVSTVAAVLKAEGKDDITCTSTQESKKLNTYLISWTDDLANGTDYTLDLSSTTNSAALAAGEAAKISFTTEEAGIIKVTDDFETNGVSTYGYNTKNNSGVHQYQDIQLTTGGSHTPGVFSRVEGYNGSALQIKTPTTGSGLNALHTVNASTPAVSDNGDYEQFVVTYRINVKKAPEIGQTLTYSASDTTERTARGANIKFAADNGNYASFGNSVAVIDTGDDGKLRIHGMGASTHTFRKIEEDHWYNIVWSIDGVNQKFTFVDEATGEVVWSGDYVSSSYTAGDAIYVIPYDGRREVDGNYIYNHDQTVLLDDFTLWRIKPEIKKQKLAVESVEVPESFGKDSEITMTFNQPVLADEGMFELYQESAAGQAGALSNEIAYSSAIVRYTDFCTQKVSFSNLDYLTDYTLDYSAMKAVSGADLDDAKATSLVEFTTAASSDDVSIIGGVVANGLTAGSNVNFNIYGGSTADMKVYVAFYKHIFPGKRLIGVETADVSVAEGETTPVSIPLSADYLDADCIKVFAWKNDGSLVPLMTAYEITAPKESLKVLMIGNSLSEDANRYLNNVALAGGLELDLTVKGIGGATLQNHADNLKAELAGRTAEEAQAQMDAGEVECALYFTYKNGIFQTSNNDNLLLTDALKNEQYDVISLQQFAGYTEAEFKDALPYLAAEIRKLQPNAEIMMYQTWSPYSSDSSTRDSYFTATIEPAIDRWATYIGENVANITINNEPMKVIAAGRAFYLADKKFDFCGTAYTTGDGNTDEEAKDNPTAEMDASLGLWRDFNHASYYGCYLADAVWFEMLTGKKAETVDAEGNPLVPAPTGIDAQEHLSRLENLSDIAHQVVLEQNK